MGGWVGRYMNGGIDGRWQKRWSIRKKYKEGDLEPLIPMTSNAIHGALTISSVLGLFR